MLAFNIVNARQASVKESMQSFRTYPFDDPNPVARMGNIYPYFRFEGYSITPRQQEWKVVTLENPYIRVLIAPEIGGKILGAFEKKTGKDFIYYNRVVKFREIAMRGPWTSGGIEFNFGEIGHTPTTATPVDYLTRSNDDGSVSCFVAAMDLASRTHWTVEIRLPADKAYFETSSSWSNPTSSSTSLYHWMNAAADASPDLQFVYPGTGYIDHGGNAFPYPDDPERGNISQYAMNRFGSHKSYHVLGTYTDFFGAYYAHRDGGVIHLAPFEDKPGKKIWMWSQARDGEIWTDLLTDPELGNGQYVEIQSGLLFNQAGESSTRTPFKHRSFAPHDAERFTEAWYPVLGIGGVIEANDHGALNVERNGSRIAVSFCPVQRIQDTLKITSAGIELYSKPLNLNPLEVFQDSFQLKESGSYELRIGKNLLSYHGGREKDLQRPKEPEAAYDWNSPFGLYTRGRERARQRDLTGALKFYLECLKKDSSYLPALVGAAECHNRNLRFADALQYASRALRVDAYDPSANFIYGVVNRNLGAVYDARDGFGRAAQSSEYRSAASTELAEISLLQIKWEEAERWARKALDYNRYNVQARRFLAVLLRIQHRSEEAAGQIQTMLELDPLDHFARFEQYLLAPSEAKLGNFRSHISTELPHERYLEIASVYLGLHRYEEVLKALDQAPFHPIVAYWKASCLFQTGNFIQSQNELQKALQASPFLVYPFRKETLPILDWAEKQSPHWKNRYYLALLTWSLGRTDLAETYFRSCGDSPDYAPFYIARGNFLRNDAPADAERDYRRAVDIGPNEWRTYRSLAAWYRQKGASAQALDILKTAAGKFPSSYVVLFDYAEILLLNRRFDESLSILDTLTILPFEGAGYGRQTYREACVLAAIDRMNKGEFDLALPLLAKAQEWPERLGVGKPLDVDNRLEEFLEARCYSFLKREKEEQRLLQSVALAGNQNAAPTNSNTLLSALSLRALGKSTEAAQLLSQWIKNSPQNPVARWASLIFAGNNQEASAILEQLRLKASPNALNPVPADPQFHLVVEAVNSSLIEFEKK